jgi:hypothetical protein
LVLKRELNFKAGMILDEIESILITGMGQGGGASRTGPE